jgi:hypothetical protein
LAAYGCAEAGLADLPALRDRPGPAGGPEIPPRFLRYCDEQTVVGLAAVLRAIDAHDLRSQPLDGWGVLAAPQFPGRVAGAATFARFHQGGPSTISPHIIPQHSLHSLSSAVSIALGMRGPNFGIGGGFDALAEGMVTALSFLDVRRAPGLWLVLTSWTPEPVPDGSGACTNDPRCHAVALALVPGDGSGACLRLVDRPWDAAADGGNPSDEPAGAALAVLAALLTGGTPPGRTAAWSCPLPWGGRIELTLEPHRQRKAA